MEQKPTSRAQRERTSRLNEMKAGIAAVNATTFKPLCVWPKGRPLEWRTVLVPVEKQQLAWRVEARRLRGQGWSLRRIAARLGQTLDAVRYALGRRTS
jgi:hypothetical protein